MKITRRLFSRPANRQRGQGMSEYLIIVALIAVAAIGVVGGMGGTISAQIGAMSKELSGQDGNKEEGDAKSAADGGADDGTTQKNLSNYASSTGSNIGQ